MARGAKVALALVAVGGVALEVFVGRTGPSLDAGLLVLRGSRTFLAVLAGGYLAVAGISLQALFANPLVDPYLVGISPGAALGYAVAAFAGVASVGVVSLPAALGAFGALAVVYVASLGDRRGERLILSGILVGFFCSALAVVFMVLSRSEATRSLMLLWGNLGVVFARRDLPVLGVAAAFVAASAVHLLLLSRRLDAVSLGDEAAVTVGVNPRAVRWQVFVSVAVGVGVLTSVVGAVGFVGLVVPYLARTVAGARTERSLPVAALLGAGFVCWADFLLGLAVKADVPVGIATSLVGAPFLMWALRRRGTALA